MSARCANPACATGLRSPREGMLFQFDVRSISMPCEDAQSVTPPELPKRQTAHFWLCGDCAARMRVVLQARAVRVAPRESAVRAESESFVPAPYACIRETADGAFRRFRPEKLPDLPNLT